MSVILKLYYKVESHMRMEIFLKQINKLYRMYARKKHDIFNGSY